MGDIIVNKSHLLPTSPGSPSLQHFMTCHHLKCKQNYVDPGSLLYNYSVKSTAQHGNAEENYHI